ncbi:hypothetical protein HanIR_Chr17g0889511 [Helianthus annuus]|nr:hypothetical protein HanIR_Chr17g0889511 [Helianthus annuus]
MLLLAVSISPLFLDENPLVDRHLGILRSKEPRTESSLPAYPKIDTSSTKLSHIIIILTRTKTRLFYHFPFFSLQTSRFKGHFLIFLIIFFLNF